MVFDDSSSNDASLLVEILSEMVTKYLVRDEELREQESTFPEVNMIKK